jgi:HSP20 family protein
MTKPVEIKADYDESKEEKGKNWLRRECNSMSFYRALELPEELKTDNVEAELKDGVFKVYLPKVKPKPEHKAKKVQIK